MHSACVYGDIIYCYIPRFIDNNAINSPRLQCDFCILKIDFLILYLVIRSASPNQTMYPPLILMTNFFLNHDSLFSQAVFCTLTYIIRCAYFFSIFQLFYMHYLLGTLPLNLQICVKTFMAHSVHIQTPTKSL